MVETRDAVTMNREHDGDYQRSHIVSLLDLLKVGEPDPEIKA